jgi:hypothetical protein
MGWSRVRCNAVGRWVFGAGFEDSGSVYALWDMRVIREVGLSWCMQMSHMGG